MQHLSLDNHPIVGVMLPGSLQKLSFGYGFNHQIPGVLWPACLKDLSFGACFDQPAVGLHGRLRWKSFWSWTTTTTSPRGSHVAGFAHKEEQFLDASP